MSDKKLEKNMLLYGVIFAVYAVLTFIGAVNHELWFDEAQAWVIARDNTISGIFRQIGYEGHPPLWYMILYIPSHLGLPCTVMPYISWFITAIAGALIMFKAPFHIVTKAAVLFSGGFLFLNSVMSRVYCLINLFIVLIVLVYPNRKKYPVLYGFLIALLANTHICVSGFIGIIGIFMLTDLFKGLKANGAKQNIKEIAGLAVAGAGVLTMVIPLLNSLSLNSSTSEISMSVSVFISSFAEGLINVSRAVLNYGVQLGGSFAGIVGIAEFVFSGFMAAAFIAMIIVMRHKTRPFLMLLFFEVFYIITTEVFWLTIPNRALVFVTMFFAVLWLSECEQENNSADMWNKIDLKADSAALKKLIEFVKRADTHFRNSYVVLITAIMFISVPMGAYYLFSDYAKSFCPSEAAAEFVRENIPEGSVFVTDKESCAEISAYLPEYKFYSTEYGRFYTYCTHENAPDEEVPQTQIYDDLKDLDKLYHMYICPDIDYLAGSREYINIIRDGMPYGTNARYVEIAEYDLKQE